MVGWGDVFVWSGAPGESPTAEVLFKHFGGNVDVVAASVLN